MPPLIFFIGIILIIGVIAAYVILELFRPYPDKRTRKQQKAKEVRKQRYQKQLDEKLAIAEEKDKQYKQEQEDAFNEEYHEPEGITLSVENVKFLDNTENEPFDEVDVPYSDEEDESAGDGPDSSATAQEIPPEA